MKKFEYACVSLVWSGKNKGISITQFGETKVLSFNANKKLFQKNHFQTFNSMIGILGGSGWELVSISNMVGACFSIFSNTHTTESQSQEFWFKRELSQSGLPSIEHTLSETFEGATIETYRPNQEKEKKDLWFG